jgi:histidine ammonia-lyase
VIELVGVGVCVNVCVIDAENPKLRDNVLVCDTVGVGEGV